jgi:hypothetical protein
VGTNAQNIDFPLPIVMIHGIRSCWQDWDSWMGYLLNSEKLPSKYPKGYIVFTPTYHFVGTEREIAIAEIINQLDKDIRGLFRQDKPNLNFICHSNGGVVIRLLTEDSFWKSKINRIYTLGTPHSGSTRFERLIGRRFALDRVSMAGFNERYRTFNGVNVVAIGGTANEPFNSLARRNDFIVTPQDSVFNIGSIGIKIILSENFDFSEDDTVKTVEIVLPKSVTQHFEPENEVNLFHSNMGGRPNFLETGREAISMLETLIFSTMVFADLSVSKQMEVATQNIAETGFRQTQPLSVPKDNPLSLIHSQETSLSTGEQKIVETPVSSATQAQFSFYAETKIEIALIDPDGTTIKPDTIKSYPGATHNVNFSGEYIISVQNPKSGIWKSRVNNIGQKGTVITSARLQSGTNFLAILDSEEQEYAPFSQAVLKAKLFHNKSGLVKLNEVTATIRDTSWKEITKITLSEKKSNLYEGRLNVPSQVGYYYATFEARGTEQGNKFQRQFETEFRVIQKNDIRKETDKVPDSNIPLSFSLSGNLKTDVEINAGDSVTISASGQVVLGKRVGGCSADGRETSVYELGSLIVKGGGSGELVARHGALLARINAQGNEKWIIVGSNKTFVAPNSGVLELQVNDKKYEDNQGKFDVQVRINRVK